MIVNKNARALRRWLLALGGIATAIVVSYYWFDRPIALFVHAHLPRNSKELLEPVTYVPNPLIAVASIAFLVIGTQSLAGRPLSKVQTTVLLCSVSIIIGETLKGELKFVFGRSWPETWHQNSPSFIRHGVYGFHWFHGGHLYQSFPSGHTAAVSAVASVLWVYYPRLRALCLAATLALIVLLVGTNFHFLSDTFGGAFLGASVGLMMTALFAKNIS